MQPSILKDPTPKARSLLHLPGTKAKY